MPPSAQKTSPFKVVVAEDRLKAWIQLPPGPAGRVPPPTIEDLLALLTQAQVVVTPDVRARAQELVATLTTAARKAAAGQPPELPAQVLIAEGRPAVNATDGRFEWIPELAQRLAAPDAGEQIDYFSRHAIITVDAGAKLGRVFAPRDGVNSQDVMGLERPPRKPKGTPFKLGPGIRLADPALGLVEAETSGWVVCDENKIQITEVLAIPGDVDFASGSVDACVDVYVRGTVRSRFKVRTTKSLSVDRVIEAADVQVGGDLVVRGGIFGQERNGRVRTKGSVTVQLLNEADVEAGGDVHFRKEVLNSRVRTFGRLVGERGTIIGGEVHAREGIEVRVIGSDAGVATYVGVGTDVNVHRRARRMEREVKELAQSARQIRQSIQPLVANMKRLLPAQRERATELLSKADELEMQVEDTKAKAAQLVKGNAPRGKPSILVGEAAYPGTRIGIDTREVRLNKPLHGPVRVELRKVNDVTEVVAVNQRTGSVTVLPSTEADLDAPPTDEPTPKRGATPDEAKPPTANNRQQSPAAGNRRS